MNENFYKYYILKDQNLVIEILSGKFELSDYLKLKQSQFENPDYDPNFNLVLDIRNIENDLSEETIKGYIADIKPIQVFTNRIKAAVITNSPSQVVGATLYRLFEERAINCEIFSTLEYALIWLGISKIDLKDMILTKC